MKISKTQDGNDLHIDLFDKAKPSPRGVLIFVGVAVLATGAVFIQRMSKYGLRLSSVASVPAEVADTSNASEPTATQPPIEEIAADLPEFSAKHELAVDTFSAAMALSEGMDEWITSIEDGVGEGQIYISVTPYFMMQSKAVRKEVATILGVSWQEVYQPEDREFTTMLLFDPRGRHVGGMDAYDTEAYAK